MADKKKILQIIPAQDWYAVFKGEGGPPQDALSPLACWALVELDDGTRSVEGLGADDYVDFVEDAGNFARYIHGSDVVDEEDEP